MSRYMLKYYIILFLTISSNLVAQNPTDSLLHDIQGMQNPIDPLLQEVENLQKQYQEEIDQAFTAMQEVQDANAYVESLSELLTNAEIPLPFGIKNGEYELIVQKIKYNTEIERTEIYATVAFQFKDDEQKIAFRGVATIEGQKGLGTQGYLELIAPVQRNLGQHATLIFNTGTKLTFGCGGVESFQSKLDLILTSPNIIPVDKDGNPTNTAIKSSFEATFFDFEDFSVAFNINKSFMYKGLQDVIFTLKNSTIDQSDILTSETIKFPNGYFTDAYERPLWKGLYISNAQVALPAIFKNTYRDSSKTDTSHNTNRFIVGINNTILDENGLTGKAYAYDILVSELLDKNKWDISITDFALGLYKNELVECEFGGDVNIPPLGNNSLLPYTATFNPSTQEYDFTAGIEGKYDFPVLRSSLSLNETSTIEIIFKGAEIYPSINASGFISVDAPLSKTDTTKKFTLPDVSFENMTISREDPYFGIGAIGLSGVKSPSVAGFELSIADILPFNDPSGIGISFDVGVKLTQMFPGETGLKLYGDYKNWKFDRLGMDKLYLGFESKAYSISGGVDFKNGDAIYGSGFRGELDFEIVEKFKFEAIGVFGKVNNYRYFLADTYLELNPSMGIMVPPALSFYGFGGGIYQRMQQTMDLTINSEFGESLSGIRYIPDNKVGMGFMATTKFGLIGSGKAFNAKVSFEMQFNNHGGLNFVQFRGDASFMNTPEAWGKLADNINDKVKKIEKLGGTIELAAKDDLKVPQNKADGFLTASLNVKLDIANNVFSADLSTYLDAGFIKGVGPNDRMGWASAYFSDDKWYTYIGTPNDRLGVEILGLAKVDGYFMLGNDIPEIPLPPQKVLQNFSSATVERLTRRDDATLTQGSGIAFGQSMSVQFDATLTPFYAHIGAGLGSEFLLKNYGADAYCAGGTTNLGINGWYARAQAWSWIEADIGMQAKIFGEKRKFSILDISASALLAGAGPNPFYFTGAVGGQFNVMGGLISGQCDFDFEIGEKCVIMGGSPFGEEIIAQLTPANNEKDVNVFTTPQAIFNIPVGLEMQIEEGDGHYAWYKINLEQFEIVNKDDNRKITGYQELSEDGKVCIIDPDEPFESQTELVVKVKVAFMRKLNGRWISVKDDKGDALYEQQELTFTTGDRPEEILPEHIAYSYPIARQYNYYPDEYKNGYILLSENYSYLLNKVPEGFEQQIKLYDSNGSAQSSNFSYSTNSAGNDIRLEIDFSTQSINFKSNEIYKLALVNVPIESSSDIASNVSSNTTNFDNYKDIQITTQEAEGNLQILQDKEILAFHFRSSKYNTLESKLMALNISYNGYCTYIQPYIYHTGANINEDEFFDRYEMSSPENNNPLIQFEANNNKTNWFKNSVYKDMYSQIGINEIQENRLENTELCELGYPPNKGVRFYTSSHDNQLTENEIQTGTATGQYPLGLLAYELPLWCSKDFYLHRTIIGLKIAYNQSISTYEQNLMEEDHPILISKGYYYVDANYILPGRDITTSVTELKFYNPIKL